MSANEGDPYEAEGEADPCVWEEYSLDHMIRCCYEMSFLLLDNSKLQMAFLCPFLRQFFDRLELNLCYTERERQRGDHIFQH